MLRRCDTMDARPAANDSDHLTKCHLDEGGGVFWRVQGIEAPFFESRVRGFRDYARHLLDPL